MKAKKILAAIALTLAATTLVACSDNDQSIDFSPYWNKHWNVSEQLNETLEYDVTFEKDSGYSNVNYELDYKNGTYTTKLVEDATETGKYTYTTELKIDAVYTYGEKTETLTDHVTTEVVFTAKNGLMPMSSKKTIVSHSPSNSRVSHVSQAYDAFYYEIETSYAQWKDEIGTCKVWDTKPNKDGSERKELVSEETFDAYNGKYSYVDNEQLILSLRCISTSTDSAKVKVYSPFSKDVQKVKLAFTDPDDDEESGMKVRYFDYTTNPNATEKIEKTIPYRSVTLKLSDSNPGTTQTAWIAKYEKPDSNPNRNVILKLETPLAYNLGKLVYSLKSINRI